MNADLQPSIWIEWKQDSESIWAEVYGTHPRTKKLYPGDNLVTFDRIFGKWYCREFESEEFRNSRSLKKWTERLFEKCDLDPNTFRNHSKHIRNEFHGNFSF